MTIKVKIYVCCSSSSATLQQFMALMLAIDTPPSVLHSCSSISGSNLASSNSFGVYNIHSYPKIAKTGTALLFFCHFFTFHLHICVSCHVLSFISSVCQHETVISFLCFFVPPLHVNLFYHSLKSVWWKEARLNQHVGSLLCNDPAMNG